MLEQKICAIIQRIAPHVEAGFDTSADLYRELGVKSIAALDLLLSLEDAFGVAIPDEDFGEARTVEKLAALVRSLRAEQPNSAAHAPERAFA